MNGTGTLQILGRLPLLSGMPDRTREQVALMFASVSEEIALEPGEELIHEGALGGTVGYVLLRGAVEVNREGAEPVRLEPPALLGEMQQFNPQALRTASVRVVAPGAALRFRWPQLYAHARVALNNADQAQLLTHLERLVWDRVHGGSVAELALFREMPEALRLRAALALLWIARPREFPAGTSLFEQGQPCGGVGHLLVEGEVALVSGAETRSTVHAPDLLGVLPDFDPDRTWTATARAVDDVTVYVFSWQEYTALLAQRLDEEAFAVVLAAARRAAGMHFTY